MRILYFADIRFPLERANGIQTMETCHALARRGHAVTLIVRPDSERPPRDPFAYYDLPPVDDLRIETAPVAGPVAARRLGYLAYVAGRAAGRGRAEVVFTRDLGVASGLLRIPRRMRPPLVYESHGFAPEVAAALPDLLGTAQPSSTRKLSRLQAREARVWRMADGYVTITAGLAEALGARFGRRAHLAVVPDGTRPPHEAPVVRPAAAPFRVAYAGHLYPWKGVDILLEALARTATVDGLIVGGHAQEPDLTRLQSLARELGIAGRVTFTGQVPPGRVRELLAGADVLALPNPASAISTAATSPLKLFEYMAAGKPIVASDLPAIREILQNEVTALLVPPGDASALAAAIDRLRTAPELGARLAREAASVVVDFSWERRAARLEALLDGVVRARG